MAEDVVAKVEKDFETAVIQGEKVIADKLLKVEKGFTMADKKGKEFMGGNLLEEQADAKKGKQIYLQEFKQGKKRHKIMHN